jgi:hypothetical protein
VAGVHGSFMEKFTNDYLTMHAQLFILNPIAQAIFFPPVLHAAHGIDGTATCEGGNMNTSRCASKRLSIGPVATLVI